MNPETERNINVFMHYTMPILTAIIIQLILIGAFIVILTFYGKFRKRKVR